MGLTELVTIINEATNYLFGVGIIVIVWLIIFSRRRNVTPTREAIVGASWITMLISVFMRVLGFINDWIFSICIVLWIGSIVMLINRE